MLVLNNLSRYYVAKFAVQTARKSNPKVNSVADRLAQEIDKKMDDFWVYIKENGKGTERVGEPNVY
jgi:phosphoketolase